MNTMTELALLALSRPRPDASAEQVAAWYDAKGLLHEHLAADTIDPADEAVELAYAAAAYEHARRLTRPAVPDLVPDLVMVGGAVVVTTLDVVNTYGAKALARFVSAGAVFLLLHFLRWLLLLAVRVLDVQLRRVDAYATRQANPVIITNARPRTDTRGEYRYAAYAYAP